MEKNKNTDLFEKFLRIIDTFNRFEVQYVVIGGVAMITHGMPRLTQDLDLLLELSDTNITRLQQALQSIYDDTAIDEITHTALEESSVIRYGTPDNFYLDLMGRIGEVADFHSVRSERRIIGGVAIILATAESLLQLKRNTIRPEDKRDCLFLERLIEERKKD